jgi:hypothetical protein
MFSPRVVPKSECLKKVGVLPAVRVGERADTTTLGTLPRGSFGFVAFGCSCAVAAASALSAQIAERVDFSLGPTKPFRCVSGDDVAGDECVWLAVVNGSTAHSAWES